MKNSKGRDSRKRGSGQRSQMYEAICDECGQKCEVPFKPTGDKPVYCSNCFTKRQGGGQRRQGGRDFGRGRSRDRDRKMYKAICDKCGKECQVPFQPTPGKPIYCDNCFERPSKGGGAGAPKGDQLASINAKLDKIINALIAAKIIKPEPSSAKATEGKKREVKKEVKAKKTAPKKVVKKKAAAKKSTVSKKSSKKKK